MKIPVVVIVVAIVCILFGGLGLCGNGFTYLVLSLSAEMLDNDPVILLIERYPLYAAFTHVMLAVSMMFCVVAIAAGVGMFGLRPWARTAGIVYGWYCVASVVIGALTYAWIHTVLPLDGAAPAVRAKLLMNLVMGLFALAFTLCFGAGLIYLLYRPHVVQAFATGGLPADNPSDAHPPRSPAEETGNPYQSPS